MNNYYLFEIPVLISSALPVIAGAFRLEQLDKASKIIFFLLVLDMITEFTAYLSALYYRNNLVIYNVTNLVQIFLICLYFNATVTLFRKHNVGLVIGFLSVAIGVLDMIFYEPANTYNSCFFIYQSVIVISMGAFLYMQLLSSTRYLKLSETPHFWFVILILVFNALNFFTMSLYSVFISRKSDIVCIDNTISVCNDVTNVGFAIVFLLYHKLKPVKDE